MKKIVLSMLVGLGLLVAGSSAVGKEATSLKDGWSNLTSNGVVQMSSNTLVNYYGTQENIDLCIANNWDASLIAKALAGKKFTYHIAAHLSGYLTVAERIAFVPVAANGVGKVTGMIMARGFTKTLAPDGTFDAVFAMPDVVIVNADMFLNSYIVMLSQNAKKGILVNELTVRDFSNWLLLGGALKTAADVTIAKEYIKRLTTPLAKRSLRSKGKSFVSTTSTNEAGVVTVINPIEQEVKPIVDALNAPKLAGLEAALTGIGVATNGIVRDESVWDAITAEKDAIYYGDKTAHSNFDGGIILLLGPDGYNAWVKEYNEGK